MENQSQNSSAQQVRRLKVFGVGRAGISIVNRLIQSGMPETEFIAVATDSASVASTTADRVVVLESKRLRGLGTGGDPARGIKAAEENLSKLKSLCQGAEIVFVIVGLGGGTGTGVSPVVARAARQSGALVTGFAVLPFECEGETRGLNAARGLESLRTAADAVICLPNQKILQLIDEEASVAEAFDRAGSLLADGVRAVWRLINLKGPIELNFEDVNAVLRDRHSEGLFAVAEGFGSEKVSEVLERLRAHPLLDEGRDLERADAVLVSVVSGPEFGMVEINRLMAEINRHCSRARVVLGVALSEEFTGRLVVTVIVSCRGGTRRGGDAGETGSKNRTAGVADEESDDLFPRLLGAKETTGAPTPRFVPPPPDIPRDRLQQTASRRSGRRRPSSQPRQEQLPLEVVSKGRFEKGEPTVLHGEDLDVPTYVRRGVALN